MVTMKPNEAAPADEQHLLDHGYRRYTGDRIDVYYRREVCWHSGRCVRGLPAVFDLARKPWVLPDAGEDGDVARVVGTCPSGALRYIRRGDGPASAAEHE